MSQTLSSSVSVFFPIFISAPNAMCSKRHSYGDSLNDPLSSVDYILPSVFSPVLLKEQNREAVHAVLLLMSKEKGYSPRTYPQHMVRGFFIVEAQ